MSDKLALKDKFKNGAKPTQEDFQMLIDYCINNTHDDDGEFHENEYRIKKQSESGYTFMEIQLQDMQDFLPYSVEVYIIGCHPVSGHSISNKTIFDGAYNEHVWINTHNLIQKECTLTATFTENKIIMTCYHNENQGDFEHFWKIKVLSRNDVYTIE